MIKFTNIKYLGNYEFNSIDLNAIYILYSFRNWKSIVQQIYLYHNLIISGIDSSKRHYISKLHTILINHLSFFTDKFLLDLEDACIKYNIPKDLIHSGINLKKFYLLDSDVIKNNEDALKFFIELHSDFFRCFWGENYYNEEFFRENLELNLTETELNKKTRLDKSKLKVEQKHFKQITK